MLIGTITFSPLSAIYIELPADVSVPQSYAVHCITSGSEPHILNVQLFLETHGSKYYNSTTPPVSGYHQYPAHSELGMTIYDYSEEVVWRADTVVVDGTEFSDQGLTKYNGDHDWACHVKIKDGFSSGVDKLQTYIRGEDDMNGMCTMLLAFPCIHSYYSSQLHTH